MGTQKNFAHKGQATACPEPTTISLMKEVISTIDSLQASRLILESLALALAAKNLPAEAKLLSAVVDRLLENRDELSAAMEEVLP